MREIVSADDIAELLSEGLDLCVRARKLDEQITLAVAAGDMSAHGGTRCLTPALWVQDQYDTDVADWQERARRKLSIWQFANMPIKGPQPR
jgi:hypothetical protein